MGVRHADPRLLVVDERSLNVPEYQCGTWGPIEADRLIQEDGRQWRTL